MSFGTVQAEKVTTESGYSLGAGNASSFKNRIINGSMVFDQRNAGASVNNTTSSTYTLDRWQIYGQANAKFSVQQNAGSVTPPAGFTKYAGITSLTALSTSASDLYIFRTKIEGYNVADLGWGAAGASPITISFWVRSSLTGTFGGALGNDSGSRSYAFTYTISSANTWEYKTITIPGDTSGTWDKTNAIGIAVVFGIGVGTDFTGPAGSWASANYYSANGCVSVVATNAATWYVTGVQLEVGTVATSFDFRSYGTELALCQRYYYRITGVTGRYGLGFCISSTQVLAETKFPVPMRVSPTALEQTGTAGDYYVSLPAGSNQSCSAVPAFNTATNWNAFSLLTASSLSVGYATTFTPGSTSVYLGWSAEL